MQSNVQYFDCVGSTLIPNEMPSLRLFTGPNIISSNNIIKIEFYFGIKVQLFKFVGVFIKQSEYKNYFYHLLRLEYA